MKELKEIRHTDSLIGLIKKRQLSNIAEVGVWKSHTCRSILRNCSKIIQSYWAIDQWKVLPDGFGRMSKRTAKDWEDLHLYACKLCLYFPQLKIVRAESIMAASIFPFNYFDLVYIDADHRFEEVLKDITAWRPLVKEGGFIAGHDYGSARHTGVKQAVDSIFSEVSILPTEVWLKQI